MDATVRSEMARLQAEFRRRGFYRPATARILLEWTYNLTLAFVGLAGCAYFQSWWLKAASLLLSTLGMTGISTGAHTAAHGAALPWRPANSCFAYLGYPFLLMVSVDFWRHKHNHVHHTNPNVIGVDDDCDLMPYFAMNEAEVRSAGPVGGFYYRHVQGWIFPLAVTLNGFNVQRASWAHLVGRLLDRRTRRPAQWIDLLTLLAHVGVWIVVPCLLWSVADGLLLYFLRIGLVGHAMFFAFAPAHYPAEADLVDAPTAERDALMRQTQTTLDFRTGLIGRLACNGVEFQIEHHLFPGICHVYYPQAAPLVREFCRRNGYPYRCLGWGEASLKSYAALFRPRPILALATALERPSEPSAEAPVPAGAAVCDCRRDRTARA
jgi:linoleoyl-CoA desaturase